MYGFPCLRGKLFQFLLWSPSSVCFFHALSKEHVKKKNVFLCKIIDRWVWIYFVVWVHSIHSVTQLCLTLCDPMNCSSPGLPVHHLLLEFTQTHVRWVGDIIKPSHPLSFPSLLTFNLSRHQGLFQGVSSSHQVAKVLEFQLQHQSFQWIFRIDCLSVLQFISHSTCSLD